MVFSGCYFENELNIKKITAHKYFFYIAVLLTDFNLLGFSCLKCIDSPDIEGHILTHYLYLYRLMKTLQPFINDWFSTTKHTIEWAQGVPGMAKMCAFMPINCTEKAWIICYSVVVVVVALVLMHAETAGL